MSTRNARVQDCIIGSGAAGGLLAQRLAEAGREVLVLEEGPRVSKDSFTQREDEMYALLYREAGSQLTEDGGISVLQGRCLGGSTTINMGDCVPIKDVVLDHWRERCGWAGWGGISNEDVHQAAAYVQGEMGAGPIPPELINRNNELLARAADRLGWSSRVLHHNRTGCVRSGYCLIGCAYDAKRGTLLTHIPPAERAGARLWTDSAAARIELDGGRAKAVLGPGFRIEAERVFLCAGSIHSPGLLSASGVRHPQLGGNLSLQPQGTVIALFEEEIVWHRGVPQSWVVDEFAANGVEHGLGGFVLEGFALGPVMTASMIPLEMGELLRLLKGYRHFAGCLCLVPDQPTGRVSTRGSGRRKIRYGLSEPIQRTLRRAFKAAARAYLSVGAKEVRIPALDAPPLRSLDDLPLIDELSLRSADISLIAAHPQGSLRMGPDPASSVVDLDFKLRGASNLYVCDASIFPSSSSTHTMVPTQSMAHILAQQLTG